MNIGDLVRMLTGSHAGMIGKVVDAETVRIAEPANRFSGMQRWVEKTVKPADVEVVGKVH